MSGDIVAILLGCASLAVYCFSEIRVRSLRRENREQFLHEFGGKEERRED